MTQVTLRRAIDELQGPIHGRIADLRASIEHDDRQEIDDKLAALDRQIRDLVSILSASHLRRADIPVDVVHGTVSMRPPLLFSIENPDGVLLEHLLEQVLKEMAAKQEREPCRETSLVVTKLEEALLWQQRRGVKRGTTEVTITDPRRV